MDTILYSFSAQISSLLFNFTSTATLYENRITITRSGRLGGIPETSTIYFKDCVSVTYGKASGRSWITFSVPGHTHPQSVVAMQSPRGGPIATPPAVIPYWDDFSIVFSKGHEAQAKKHFDIVNKHYAQFRASSIPVNTPQDNDSLSKLKKLHELKTLGILTEEEYEVKRKELIDQI